MKFVIDERLKYRLTGVVVLVSVLAIFLPAMMKKSNQRFDESLNVSMRLPQKPALPNIAVPNQQEMFKTVKVAHVEIKPLPEESQTPQIAKAEPLKVNPEPSVVAVVSPKLQTKPEIAVVPSPLVHPKSVVAPIALETSKTAHQVAQTKQKTVSQGQYAVQLASFAQLHNAELLVTKLRSKGYVANYSKLNNKNGAFYKVIVGQVNEKNEAIDLQKKIANAMQINGFVVKTGVS